MPMSDLMELLGTSGPRLRWQRLPPVLFAGAFLGKLVASASRVVA